MKTTQSLMAMMLVVAIAAFASYHWTYVYRHWTLSVAAWESLRCLVAGSR